MVQNSKVLTREANPISLISTEPATTLEDYPVITEREVPMSTIEQTWIFEVEEETPVGRTTPKSVNTLVKIVKWLNHLGSGKIDDSCLESRHNIHHEFRINV
jgi:hypothetical protein